MHTDLAGGYYERAQMDIAIEELNLAVATDPGYAPAYNLYGLVYAVLGDDRKAEQSFERALALAPNDSDVHHNWGWYLCQHKREREALQEKVHELENDVKRASGKSQGTDEVKKLREDVAKLKAKLVAAENAMEAAAMLRSKVARLEAQLKGKH